ncbi:MAG: hypothetical protein HY466_07130 [Deltaproteobacteria bacterium]|nr:hypothetical protein [Deltaproteobacteria bacterium]
MSFTFDYQFRGKRGILEIEKAGVFYLDLSEERPIAYSNPAAGPPFLILCGRQEVFAVWEGKGHRLAPEQPFSAGGLTLSWRPEEIAWGRIQPYLQTVLHWIQTERKKALGLGSAVLVLLVIGVILAGSKEGKLTQETVVQATQELKGNALFAVRLKLSEQALEEKNYPLAAELADKVLTASPANPQAMALKEKALASLEASQKESQIEVKKEIRFKEILDQVTALMAAKDYHGALFRVQQVLEADPGHAEAFRMHEAIQKELANLEQKEIQTVGADAESLERAEELWKSGKGAFDAENYGRAWRNFIDALALLKERNLHPPFRVDLNELLTQTEAALADQARPMVDQARELRNLGQNSQGQKRAEYFSEALTRYYAAEKIYPEFEGLRNEIGMVIERLNKAVEPFFVEAQTMKDLEGCCPSHPHFKKVMGLAKYESVPLYKQAKEMLEICPCR